MINTLLNIADNYIQPESEIESFENKGKITTAAISLFLFVFFMLLISLLLGQYLWNNVLTKCVTVVKPIDSFIQFLGLYVLIMILFSN